MHFPLFSEKQPEVKSLPKRTDNDPAHQWRLEDIFKTDEDWEREFEAVTAALPDPRSGPGSRKAMGTG